MPDKVLRQLSQRLQHLHQWILEQDHYDCIWDLCCDHGRLGLHLHQDSPVSKIYLVDRVPSIIQKLTSDCAMIDSTRLSIECADAGKVQLDKTQNNLVIIAGIGGETIIQILEGLLHHHQDHEFDLLLSCNSHAFLVRKFLNKHFLKSKDFSLKKEAYVHEKGWHFEHLFVRYLPQADSLISPISPVGKQLWYPMTENKKSYLNKLIQHYRVIVQNSNSKEIKENAKQALAFYIDLQDQA